MLYMLIAFIAILALLIIGMISVWFFDSPKTQQFQSHADETPIRTLRNRAWDEAVARARNRNQESF